MNLKTYFPILDWGRTYNRETFVNDGIAALVVTIMLIPQSLAYALLAGLPPQVGLYASILPLLIYAIFGTSRTLAVGPVAVVSLLTAAAAGRLAAQGSEAYLTIAIALALLSGLILLLMGLFRAGFIANFLSHPVISGFITASGIIIAVSQFKHILGIPASGHNLIELSKSLWANIGQTNIPTLILGLLTIIFLVGARSSGPKILQKLGLSEKSAKVLARLAPVLAVIVTILAVSIFQLDRSGVAIVGDIPKGLPKLAMPEIDLPLWRSIMIAALTISLIGFVESVSVAQTFAAKRRQRISPDQELIALGASNIGASISGGFPVTGGLSRSAVNFEAGAQTPAAGAYTAIGIGLATLFLTPLLFFLPKATLAATIIVAVLGLINFGEIKQAWQYSRSDFAAIITTIIVTLSVGVEIGVVTGVLMSIALFLYRSSKPHYAIVGLIPNTEHFRNVKRHKVITPKNVVSIRVDESLYFANARYLEDVIYDQALKSDKIQHVVLMCSAVNDIDLSALDSLEAINNRLKSANILFHLSEVKGPVMDKLEKGNFPQELSGRIFLTQYEAIKTLSGNLYGVDLDYHL